MAIVIPSGDRLQNRTAPINPADKTEANADNIMLLFDNLVGGGYRIKLKTYTYAEIDALADKEAGEVYFASDLQQFVGYNGTNLVVIG